MNNSRNAVIYTVLQELLYLFEYKLSTSEEESNKKEKGTPKKFV